MISEINRWRSVFHILMETGFMSVVHYKLLLRKEQNSPSILWAFMQKTSNTSAGNGLALWGLRTGADDRASWGEHLEVHQEWWYSRAFTLGLHIQPISDQSKRTVSMCSHSLLLRIAWLTLVLLMLNYSRTLLRLQTLGQLCSSYSHMSFFG